jgi:hypothetical protein
MENQQSNGQTRGLKPFSKNDPRINRRGRPRGFDELRKLAQQIASEMVTHSSGRKITLCEAILRSWARSEEPQLQRAFMECCYGRVPEKIEATGGFQNGTQLVLYYAHERRKSSEVPAPFRR